MPDKDDGRSPADRDEPAGGAEPRRNGTSSTWATRGVFGIGSASLFSDTGHEMVTSVLPTFITSTLHAGPAALGAIDGVSDALTGLSKLAGGPLANDRAHRVRLASGGYLGTAVATAAIGLATAIWQVAILRALAWVSRGIRSPARDMMLTDLASEDAYGRAFGVERAGDNAGAIAGPLLASGLVGVLGLRHTILLAFIPGVLAAVAITIAGREARHTIADPAARRTLSFNLRELGRAGLGRVLTPVMLFEFGNLATTLLILRATDLLHTDSRSLTAATSLAILLYAAHNAAATAASLVGGQIADRVNPRVVFSSGAAVYVASYLLFAVDQHAWPLVLLAFLLSGVGIGLAETAESTVIARGLPARLRANGFGVLGLTQSLGDLAATVTVGVLWSLTSPTVAFCYAAAWMLASVTASGLLRPRERTQM